MRKWKGYGFFVAMAAIILIAMISSDFMSGWTEENYTYTQFKDDLSNHKIQSVVVGQNEQVPTGEIRVTMKDSKKHSFYAPDVNVVIEKLDDAHFTNVVVSDVETTPWYLEILPYAIGFVLIFVLFFVSSLSGCLLRLCSGLAGGAPPCGLPTPYPDEWGFLPKSPPGHEDRL